MQKILFVDDERCILDGLRRSLHDMNKEWDMYFADSGKEALKLIKEFHIDAIVSDMRMPEMDGAQLLIEVMKISPFTARFILSGQSDKEAILKTVGPAHQFFSKPCDIKKIKEIICNALALRRCLFSEELTSIISKIETLPSLPQIYLDIVKELKREEASIDRIASLVEMDLGFSTKILQIVNSSFFGVTCHISSIRQAVSYLGMDILKSLALYVKVFHEYSGNLIPASCLEELMDHSLAVAKYAKAILNTMSHTRDEMENLFTAACFHDVGKLVFYSNMSKKYRECCDFIHLHHCGETNAERTVIGVTHAEVGAYLLCLWGIRDPIVEAILFHHSPLECYCDNFKIIPILYFSDCVYYELHPDKKIFPEEDVSIDMEYMEKAGVEDKIPEWRELIEKLEAAQNG